MHRQKMNKILFIIYIGKLMYLFSLKKNVKSTGYWVNCKLISIFFKLKTKKKQLITFNKT